MEFLKTLYNELASSPGINRVIDMFTFGNYDLLYIRQVTSNLGFKIILFLIVIEIADAIFKKRWQFKEYKIIFIMFV